MENKKMFFGWWIVLGCVVITSTVVPVVMALSNKYLIYVTAPAAVTAPAITEVSPLQSTDLEANSAQESAPTQAPVTQAPVTTEVKEPGLGISRSAFSLVNTLLQGLGIFLSPIIAKKMATGNLRKIMSISLIGFSAAYGSYSLAQNAMHLYISGLAVGAFYLSASLIPVSIIITNWFIKKRGLAMSLAMAGIGLGGFIFSPILTFLLESYGWRSAYQIMAVIVFVLAWPIATFLLRKKPEDMGLKPYGADEVEAAAGAGQKSAVKLGVSLSVKESRSQKFFLLMLIGMFLCGFINSGALGQFPPAIQGMHGPAVQAAIISFYSLIGIFGKILIGWLNDKFSLLVSNIFGFATFALMFVFILMGQDLSMLYVMAIFFGLGMGIGNVTPPLVVAEIFGSAKYGEAYGLANSACQIGLSTGSLVVAMIFDIFGSYDYAWMLLCVLTIATFFIWTISLSMARKFYVKA